MSKIVLSGEMAPTGQPYRAFGGVYLNHQRGVAFDAYTGPLPYQNSNGMYLASGGIIAPVILSGQISSVTGGTYVSMTAARATRATACFSTTRAPAPSRRSR